VPHRAIREIRVRSRKGNSCASAIPIAIIKVVFNINLISMNLSSLNRYGPVLHRQTQVLSIHLSIYSGSHWSYQVNRNWPDHRRTLWFASLHSRSTNHANQKSVQIIEAPVHRQERSDRERYLCGKTNLAPIAPFDLRILLGTWYEPSSIIHQIIYYKYSTLD
jgi:hypothetical protein